MMPGLTAAEQRDHAMVHPPEHGDHDEADRESQQLPAEAAAEQGGEARPVGCLGRIDVHHEECQGERVDGVEERERPCELDGVALVALLRRRALLVSPHVRSVPRLGRPRHPTRRQSQSTACIHPAM